MTSLKGVDISFEECLKMASIAELEGIKVPFLQINHLKVPFLQINHLIDNKKVVNRPKDQLDVIELERIRNLRQQKG